MMRSIAMILGTILGTEVRRAGGGFGGKGISFKRYLYCGI